MDAMTDFERGVRFVMEREERYTMRSGPELTQFGVYQMTMDLRLASEMTSGSAEHRERRILAMLALAMDEIGQEKSDG